MRTIKRALLYLVRVRAKTMVLFFILLCLAACVLSCLSIYGAAVEVNGSLQQTVGNTFTLDIDFYADPANWETVADDYGGYSSEYRGPAITFDLIHSIRAMDGVTAYSYRDVGSADILTAQGKPADILIPDNAISQKIGKEDNNHQTVYGLGDSSYDPNFYDGTFKLVEGRHIGSEDRAVCLVSADFAILNDIVLGDIIWLTPSSADVEYSNISAQDMQASKVAATVIGIFSIEAEPADPSAVTKWSMAENLVFADYSSVKSLYTWWSGGSRGGEIFSPVTFYVQDAEQLDALMERIKRTLDIDWHCFYLERRNDAYISFSNSLASLKQISGVLVFIGIVASLLILTLVLMIRTRARTREIGLYLSAGVCKGNVWGQLAMESCWLTPPAVALACFASRSLAGYLGNLLLPNTTAGTQTVGELYANSFGVIMQTPAIGHLDVGVTLSGAATVGFVFLCVTLVAVTLAATPVLRMKPKQVLSMLS